MNVDELYVPACRQVELVKCGMMEFMIFVIFFLEIQESFVFLREMKVFARPEGPLGPPHAQIAIFL